MKSALLPDRFLWRSTDHGPCGRHEGNKRSWYRVQHLRLVSTDGTSHVDTLLTCFSLSFLSLLIYSAVGYHRAKKQAQRGTYAAAHNPAVYNPAVPTPYPPQYQQNTAYYSQTAAPVEVQHNHYLPPYQTNSASNNYYTQQPLKPAHMV